MGQVKFNRNYELYIQKPIRNFVQIRDVNFSDFVKVTLPFSVSFDIMRNTLQSSQTIVIRVYNLSEITRNSILKDQIDYGLAQHVLLRAGYDQDMPVVFGGNVRRCLSVREGVDFVTQIDAYDSGYAYLNSRLNIPPFPSGTTNKEVIRGLAASMAAYGVSVGAIGAFDGEITRASAYAGNAIDVLNDLTNGGVFVDGGKIYALKEDEYIKTDKILTVNADSGLLNTPVREKNQISFEMIFEPRARLGTLIKVESNTGKSFNGKYKVVGVKHRAMISGSVCGDAITTLTVLNGHGLKPVVST